MTSEPKSNDPNVRLPQHHRAAARASARDSFAGGFQQIDLDEPGLGRGAKARPRFGISLRAVIIGMLAIVFIAAVEPYNRLYKNSTPMIGSNFPIVVIFLQLILILGINPVLKRLMPGRQLAPAELAVIFGLTYTACCVPGTGIIRFWMTSLTGGFFYSVDFPNWQGIFAGLPDWLFPSRDPDSIVIQGFWRKLQPGQSIPWQPWVVPFLAWGILFVAVFACIFCVVALVRKQWVEHEKLSFPLAQVVLEMMRPPAKGRLLNDLFRHRLLWVGAILVVVIHATNVLHSWYPDVPAIPIGFAQEGLFTNFPWNNIPYYVWQGRLYFTAIGITYFITTRCSFSLWFFVLALAGAYVVAAQFGRPITGGLYGGPWNAQFLGAMLVLMVSLAWVSRSHLKEIALNVIGREKDAGENEYMSYRVAAIGLVLSFTVAVAWLAVAGMSILAAIFILAMLLMIFLTMARIVAETGLFFFHSHFKPLIATEFFSECSTTIPFDHDSYLLGAMVSRQYWGTKENLLPYAVNALRVTDGTKGVRRRRWLIPLCMLGLILAFGVSAVSQGWLAYSRGAASFADDLAAGTAIRLQEDFNATVTFKTLAGKLQYSPMNYLILGALVMGGLAFARFRWTRWPLYPIGWLLCSSWAMHVMWISIFLGWLMKSSILKFGGAGLYNRLKPFFLGLIVGEVVSAGVFTGLVMIFDLPVKYYVFVA